MSCRDWRVIIQDQGSSNKQMPKVSNSVWKAVWLRDIGPSWEGKCQTAGCDTVFSVFDNATYAVAHDVSKKDGVAKATQGARTMQRIWAFVATHATSCREQGVLRSMTQNGQLASLSKGPNDLSTPCSSLGSQCRAHCCNG